MHIIVTSFIEKFGDVGFIAWTDDFKGLVVQGTTLDEVKREMWTSIKIKLAHDMKIPPSAIKRTDEKGVLPIVNETPDMFELQLA